MKAGSKKQVLIVASERGISLLKNSKILGANGTFYSSPKPFLQLFVLQVNFFKQHFTVQQNFVSFLSTFFLFNKKILYYNLCKFSKKTKGAPLASR